MLCKLPGIGMYLHCPPPPPGVPVFCSSLGWCLILRGVGVDSTVLILIFVVMGFGRSTCVKSRCMFSISYYTCMCGCGGGGILYLRL
jgi:hypothetical protein